MSYVVPEVVNLPEFTNFLINHFNPAVFEFNGACGKNPYEVTDSEVAVDMILNECRRVIEECRECEDAFLANDRKERLDGVVDVYWTNAQLSNLYTVFTEKFGLDELQEEIAHRAYDDQLLILLAREKVQVAIQVAQGTIISGKAIIVAALRVMANNKMKYTEDPAVAEDWSHHVAFGQNLKSYEYQGKRFFCIKRESDDYIVKPHNFKPVELGGII